MQLNDTASGAFIFQNNVPDHDYEMMNNVAGNLRISLIQNKRKDHSLDNNSLKEKFSINIDDIPNSVISSFRYAFNLERIFLAYLHEFEKKNPQLKTPKKAYNYLRNLNDKSFLYQEPISRLKFLSDLSYENRCIGAIMHNEIKDNSLLEPDDNPSFGNDYFNIFFPKTNELTPVYVAQYATLLNKLHVLEAIVEYIVQENGTTKDIISNFIEQTNIQSLNKNIQTSINELKNKTNHHLYPYFWQVFLYVFGGFILNDKKETEYKLLSQITKLPKGEINDALSVWNKLFPYDRGWFQEPNNNSNIKLLKMLPAPLYGIGVNFRLHLYGSAEIKEKGGLFDNLKNQITGTYTFNDLNGWNNSAYNMLKRDINLHITDLEIKEKHKKRLEKVRKYAENCNRYNKLESINDIVQSKNSKKTIPNGFVAYYENKTYDLYIVKDNNRSEKLNIYNTIKELHLNESLFANGIILGTDESVEYDTDDKVWYFSYFEKLSLDNIESIITESNNARPK